MVYIIIFFIFIMKELNREERKVGREDSMLAWLVNSAIVGPFSPVCIKHSVSHGLGLDVIFFPQWFAVLYPQALFWR